MRKGFTLIELLVVIAIIGLLSSIVLASLNTARTRAADTAIKAQLASMRATAEIYQAANNGYGTANFGANDLATCTTQTTNIFGASGVAPQITSAYQRVPSGSRVYCAVRSDGLSWAVAMPLNNPPSGQTGWCVDSRGQSKGFSSTFTGGGQTVLYPSGEAVCP